MSVNNGTVVEDSLAEGPWPVAARSLLTKRERELYDRLRGLYIDHPLFIQVALSQLIDVPETHPDRMSIRNRFSQLVADFVLCRSDLSIVAVIELDDRSHRRPDRQSADGRKSKALADAGLRLVRIPEGPVPSADRLRQIIEAPPSSSSSADSTSEYSSIPPAEHLRLADDLAVIPVEPLAWDHEWQAHKAAWSRAIMAGLAVAAIIGGWYAYIHLISYEIQSASQPLAAKSLRHPPPEPRVYPSALVPMPLPDPARVTPAPSKAQLEAKRDADIQVTQALDKQKQLAWAVYYKPPTTCDHPYDWNAQVECGNLYMRAKRLFEMQWARDHDGANGGAGVVLDNHSLDRGTR